MNTLRSRNVTNKLMFCLKIQSAYFNSGNEFNICLILNKMNLLTKVKEFIQEWHSRYHDNYNSMF